jgi:hypothetical protein
MRLVERFANPLGIGHSGMRAKWRVTGPRNLAAARGCCGRRKKSTSEGAGLRGRRFKGGSADVCLFLNRKTEKPGRMGVQLGFGSPPPPPRVFKAAKGAAPPDRGAVAQLGFRSEGTENTNGARGDNGCGLSGAQATAQKAVFNQANYVDVDMATAFKIPIKSSPPPLPLSSARPLLPMPLVPTPPARTTSQSHHA